MKLLYCIKLKDRKICIRVPPAYDAWWWIRKFKPSPDPWTVADPHPDPWVIDKFLDEKTVRDLSVLAAMVSLADELSPALKGTIQNTIKNNARDLRLPGEATVEIVETPAREATKAGRRSNRQTAR
ncbi:MAG: hypothetical protein ACM3ON_09555 [Chloroflexota bacterium]